ncbi:MAG: hypothetical protein LWW77_09535 [Propionibacteriales bacterium]|nr:hypothetical protein [Propionibacteriales bacterium]
MKRILSTWPYLAGVAVLAVGWLLIARFTLGSTELGGLTGLYVGTVVPLAAAAGGAVMTVRRGYDWVTVVACLVLWLVFAVIGVSGVGIVVPPAALAAATGAYLLIAHVAVVGVLAVKKLGNTSGSAGV